MEVEIGRHLRCLLLGRIRQKGGHGRQDVRREAKNGWNVCKTESTELNGGCDYKIQLKICSSNEVKAASRYQKQLAARSIDTKEIDLAYCNLFHFRRRLDQRGAGDFVAAVSFD